MSIIPNPNEYNKVAEFNDAIEIYMELEEIESEKKKLLRYLLALSKRPEWFQIAKRIRSDHPKIVYERLTEKISLAVSVSLNIAELAESLEKDDGDSKCDKPPAYIETDKVQKENPPRYTTNEGHKDETTKCDEPDEIESVELEKPRTGFSSRQVIGTAALGVAVGAGLVYAAPLVIGSTIATSAATAAGTTATGGILSTISEYYTFMGAIFGTADSVILSGGLSGLAAAGLPLASGVGSAAGTVAAAGTAAASTGMAATTAVAGVTGIAVTGAIIEKINEGETEVDNTQKKKRKIK